ncbi:hypothetical protein P9314_09470 [Paenibacillus validus]|uniref:Uncharacterized protein n=1 Tax=Paenibacillus validus TaxID=44253 RepID=A0A7X2ZEZ5_9BACL|nr:MULTISPECIES: hypothetical protein [Paenibacillus]MED4600928.1 hypothetical protein [Paenibacillus validus]MED4607222.1 hypothetical protein [Paenibacillus validus]MUG73667.1 hypothetical protein [Paenibacillus validus]
MFEAGLTQEELNLLLSRKSAHESPFIPRSKRKRKKQGFIEFILKKLLII